MNSRTARLLRKYSTIRGHNPRSAKRQWMNMPRTVKGQLRHEMERVIEMEKPNV
jgi:hypothetical protein